MAIGMRNRIFGLEGRNGNDATLIKASDTDIVRWVIISGWANPFDPQEALILRTVQAVKWAFTAEVVRSWRTFGVSRTEAVGPTEGGHF